MLDISSISSYRGKVPGPGVSDVGPHVGLGAGRAPTLQR